MADLINPEIVKALEALPTPWEARDDFVEGSKELMAMLQYIDTIGEEYDKKKEYMDVLDYMDSLLDRQKQIVKFLKAPYATDSPESVETMAEFGMEDDCPPELTLKDGTILREKDTPHRFYWARQNLILHFTQHASWRLICRNVTPENAVKASIAGRKIDYNLYWDPKTTVAAAVRGPPYDPHSRRIQIQKVTTVFPRTNEKALRAFQALEQLYFNNVAFAMYKREMPPRPPGPPSKNRRLRKQEWRKRYPDRKILDLTLDDLPDGMGNSYVPPTPEDLKFAQRLAKPKSYEIGNYNRSVLYDPDGYVVSPRSAKREKRKLQEAMKEVEDQFKEEDAYQDWKRERRGRERKQLEQRRKRQEEETQKLREESRTATLDDLPGDKDYKKTFPGVDPPPRPPANLFPTLVRQRSSNSSKEGSPDEKKVRVKTDMNENENT